MSIHSRSTSPFDRFEWLLAWRYLRSRRSEGGVSAMTMISMVGISIAVFALVATLAVRSGYRAEFVGIMLGANAHASIYTGMYRTETGQRSDVLTEYEALAERLSGVEGVVRATPIVRAQLLASSEFRNAGIELFGVTPEDLVQIPMVADPEVSVGAIADFEQGVAIGTGVARELGVTVGDSIRLISPFGAKTAFGISPRINRYTVTYVFGVGRYDIDRVRVYMPFAEAQRFLNLEGGADEIEVFVEDPEEIDAAEGLLLAAAGEHYYSWSWKDASGTFLRALEMEDNVMFIILSILVLIAASNIVSGLVMLVKNKGRDIGILRTMGLSQGSVLRVFFLCGALIGVVGTVFGVIFGCLFAIYIDPIFQFINALAGGGAWDPEVRFLSELPAKLEIGDVASAVALSLGLSFIVTIFPARRAAKMDPVEALRYE